jgi:hypothetical protein
LEIIEHANTILAEYEAQGYNLTLRQLYYQFVARGLIANEQKEYKRIGSIVSDARLAGLIDWEHIEDRTRNLEELSHWDSGAQIVRSCVRSFQFSRWDDQDRKVEVWIEKEALVGVIERTCEQYDVPYFACRGYASQSELWRAGQRLEGQNAIVLHLGDHDPSGIDMTRDNKDRLDLFTSRFDVEVKRLALNMDQVEQYDPPPNPAKLTDSRAVDYISRFGSDSWELDALEPSVINALIEDEITSCIDQDIWDETVEREDVVKAKLQQIADNWTE